jgi:predicted Zn-dependent protease
MDAYPKVSTHMSFGVGRSPSLDRIFANGAPLINSEGKAVGMFAGLSPLAAQTLRSALPIDDLGERIAAALKSPGNLPLPVDERHHSFDAARLSVEWALLDLPDGARDRKLALERTRQLMKRYPDSRALKLWEWEIMRLPGADALTAEEFLAATQRTVPPQNASDVEKAEYQFRLGTALHRMPGRTEETEAAYRKAVELAPEVAHLAAANLAGMLMQRGQTKEGEAIYREVVTRVPERIDYIEALQRAVEARGDWKASDELDQWIYQLEEYYRSP